MNAVENLLFLAIKDGDTDPNSFEIINWAFNAFKNKDAHLHKDFHIDNELNHEEIIFDIFDQCEHKLFEFPNLDSNQI